MWHFAHKKSDYKCTFVQEPRQLEWLSGCLQEILYWNQFKLERQT